MSGSILDETRYTVPEAAERLGVSESAMWRYLMQGVDGKRIPSIRIGRKRYVLERDLEAFIQRDGDGAE